MKIVRHSSRDRIVSLVLAVLLLMGTGLTGLGNALRVYAEGEGGSPSVIDDFEELTLLSASSVRANSVKLELASRPESIYYGYHAARLDYDFTGQAGTSAAYLNFKDPDGQAGRSVPGSPVKLGLWVYGDGNNHWLRAQLQDSAGIKSTVDITSASGLNWKGWRFVTIPVPSSAIPPLKINQIYVAETKDTNKNSGSLYFDRLSAFYTNSEIYGLDLAGLTPLQVGESAPIHLYATYANAGQPERVAEGVAFVSSDETVATVSGTTYGTVTALAPGIVTITATYRDAPAARSTLIVTETPPVLQKLELSGPQRLESGMTGELKAFAVYEGISGPIPLVEGVTFASDRPEIAEADASGRITAKSKGTAAITVTYKGVSAVHQVTVSDPVPVLQSIELRGVTSMYEGDSAETAVYGTYTWLNEPVKLTEGVVYTSSNPETAAVDASGKITGIRVGAARITATYAGKSSSIYLTVNRRTAIPKAEMRAAWIATVDNVDWPAKGTTGAEEQKKQFVELLDQLEAAGMNAVIVQVKPTADAFYPSEYGPWSEWLTGVQGQDPGYDPLAFMLEEAHRRNMEFHAWFNPYRISLQDDIAKLVENHPARQHPDWVVSYGGKLYFDPGNPEAKRFIIDSVMEVVKKYDIDAVHFDDYFYPYPVAGVDFPDDASFAKYHGNFTNKADWRRDNVNRFVQEVGEAIKREKSYVKFGISPFGIWKNKSADPLGSDTNGLSSYEAIYADSKTWVENEWIDYIAPQIYWYMGYSPAAYDKLIEWWSGVVRGKNVQLYSGQAVYRIGTGDGWLNAEEMPNQLLYNRNFDDVSGSMFFSAKWFAANPLGFTDRLRSDFYLYPALVPSMPWLDAEAPEAPSGLSADSSKDGVVELKWHSKGDESYYVVYRFDGRNAGSIEDPSAIVGKLRKGPGGKQTFVDEHVQKGQSYTYIVTAVDRLHNESGASRSLTVTVKDKPDKPGKPDKPDKPGKPGKPRNAEGR